MSSVKRQWVQVPPEVCSFTSMAVFCSLLFQFCMVLKPSRTLGGGVLLGIKAFLYPHFLFEGHRLQPPWPYQSSKGQVQTAANEKKGEDIESREDQPKNNGRGTFLLVQWKRGHLPMQGTQVQSPVQADSTCHGATQPMCHNYWARVLQILKPVCLESLLHNKRSHPNEKSMHCN